MFCNIRTCVLFQVGSRPTFSELNVYYLMLQTTETCNYQLYYQTIARDSSYSFCKITKFKHF